MNIRKGVKRLCVIGSVFWFIFVSYGATLVAPPKEIFWVVSLVIGLIGIWGLFYTGCWVWAGFSGKDSK